MKTLTKKKKHFRRHFQLLELMVAVFILLICIAPAMQIFTSIFKSQQEIVRENQKNHIIHLMHAKFTEQLYKRLISFDDIRNQKDIILTDPDLVDLLGKSFFTCSGIFTIEKSYKPRGQDNPVEYLCKLEIKVADKLARQTKGKGSSSSQDDPSETYDYYIYIDTLPDEGDDDEEDDEEEIEPEEDEEEEEEDDEEEEDEEEEEEEELPVKAPPKRQLSKVATAAAKAGGS